MAVSSLAYRTDLMVLGLQGSVVDRRDGYLAVRTPANPAFHWGNFLLLDRPPAAGQAADWVAAFRREFPAARHLALGVDGVSGDAGDPADLASAGLDVDTGTTLTATAVHRPPNASRDAELRMLAGDAEWRAAVALLEATHGGPGDAEYREFARRKLAAMRRLQERGSGGWFGAFLDGELACALGVYTDGNGLARFQTVATHPARRRQGLAGALVHAAGSYALGRPDVHTLVIVAGPQHGAARLYRAAGFTGTETQVRLEG